MAIIFKDDGGDLLWDANQTNPFDKAIAVADNIEKTAMGIQNRFDKQKESNLLQEQDARDYAMKVAKFDADTAYRDTMMNNAASERISNRAYMSETRRLNHELGMARVNNAGSKLTLADLKAQDIMEKKKIIGITGQIVEGAENSSDPGAYLEAKAEEANLSGNPENIRAVDDAKAKVKKSINTANLEREAKIKEVKTLMAQGKEDEGNALIAELNKELPTTVIPPMPFSELKKKTPTSSIENSYNTKVGILNSLGAIAPGTTSILKYLLPAPTEGEVELDRIMKEEAKWDKKILKAPKSQKPALRAAKYKKMQQLRGVDAVESLDIANTKLKKQNTIY